MGGSFTDKRSALSLLVITTLSVCPYAAGETQEEPVGTITTISGTVSLIRGGNETAAEMDARILVSDVIRTAEGASVGVTLRDDTRVSLGPSSELRMSEFKFEPDKGVLAMTLGVAKGTFAYISGQIAKLAPGSAKIETPAGVAAVRGTKLLIDAPIGEGPPQASPTNDSQSSSSGGGAGGGVGLEGAGQNSWGGFSGGTYPFLALNTHGSESGILATPRTFYANDYEFTNPAQGDRTSSDPIQPITPEPPTWVLLIAGLCGLAVVRTRRAFRAQRDSVKFKAR